MNRPQSSSETYDLIAIGGGAGGFFTSILFKESFPAARVLILEKSQRVLQKVKISGGGRCNVTHGCFDPVDMITNYPRGEKELQGPFTRFLCGDMMAWLGDHGVETKIEEDGRVFPVSNRSRDIIDCFLERCKALQIDVRTSSNVTGIERIKKNWQILLKSGNLTTRFVMVATGSSHSAWNWISKLSHHIIPPVPSLFTFNISSKLITDLPGLSMPNAFIRILGTKFSASGPLLITHWGLSGPAILKLSAWAARELNEVNYKFEIAVNWVNSGVEEVQNEILKYKSENGDKSLSRRPLFNVPKRLWFNMTASIRVAEKNYADLSNREVSGLAEILCNTTLRVKGKSTFKEEFVTCGGIDRREIDFRTMESKINPGLYFAGEVIDIDAITGGFNFQAAWTESYVAAQAIGKRFAQSQTRGK